MAGTNRKKKRAASKKHSRGNPQKVKTQGDPAAPVHKATPRDWIAAARPRTLPLAITPVLIGTGAAILVVDLFHWVIALFCLIVALSFQIGVNYANDYSDGIRGTDRHRVGPARLTASGSAKPRTVLIVALVFFALGALAGLAIIIRTGQWWMLAVGALCIIAAWFYTGGKRPYGYYGFGELVVFIFFGLVATLGTTWVQAFVIPQEAWFGAVVAGLFAMAVLVVNNLRDIDQDKLAGKRTLAVLIGKNATRILYTVLMVVPYGILLFLAVLYTALWMSALTLLAAIPALIIVWSYREPKELAIPLALTSATSLGCGVVMLLTFAGWW